MTYTYAILEVSLATFDEVARLLRAAGYDHAFDRDVIDMHGIALRAEEEGDPNAEETGVDGGEGAGLLQDRAVRRGGAGAAAVPASREDAGAQGGDGEGAQAGDGATGGGGGDAERGTDRAGAAGGPSPEAPDADGCGAGGPDSADPDTGCWGDDRGASGPD